MNRYNFKLKSSNGKWERSFVATNETAAFDKLLFICRGSIGGNPIKKEDFEITAAPLRKKVKGG